MPAAAKKPSARRRLNIGKNSRFQWIVARVYDEIAIRSDREYTRHHPMVLRDAK